MEIGKNENIKSFLSDLSKKNESLNTKNKELNFKILSLTRSIKVKDNKINIIKNLLIQKELKNLFFKKYIKENNMLLNAFMNLKYFKKKIYLNSKLYCDNEIFFFILKTNRDNLAEKGIGDYNINIKLYIRRQICLTLLKKRKYNTKKQTDISLVDKSFLSNNNKSSLDDNKNKNFENILSSNKEVNIFVRALNDNKSQKSMKLFKVFKIEKNANYNFYNIIKKDKNYDFSVFHLQIICNRKNNIFDDLDNNNCINFSILAIHNKKEIELLKNELNQKNVNIEEMKNISLNSDLQIKALNKKIKQLQEQLNNLKYENTLYKDVLNKNNKKNIKYTSINSNFNIISNINNANINKNRCEILYEKAKTNFKIISSISKKQINNIFNNLSISRIINYNLFPLINNNKIQKELMITNQAKINFTSKKEILSNFEITLKDIDNKNNLFKLIIFESRLNNYMLHHRFFFFIKFLHFSYNIKIKFTFSSLRNLLILLQLKHLIKNFSQNKNNYFFYKYYMKSISIGFKENKNKLSKYIHKNEELEKKINLFSDTLKQYQQTHKNENEKKNNELSNYKNTINDLNIKLEKIKNNARESSEELINCNYECNNQKKIINGLNEEINELKQNRNNLKNKISSQQELITNINLKMKQYQEENEQNEQNFNLKMKKIQSKFNECQNNINDLIKEKKLLMEDNDKMKITIENLNKSNEKMLDIVKNSQNYKIENENLVNENSQLKIDNDIIDNKYKNLKKDFEDLKILSEESKNELTKAMHEMELYSQLLQTLENKINKAENEKINALKERDKAINDIKVLRQR